ncbi:hypothetical protein AA14362_1779 [Acetobacter cerevisiae DSM 14362]|nr:hypothetical protein AA14362_1779 [Acetobacter cerevisiae DSM 14362]
MAACHHLLNRSSSSAESGPGFGAVLVMVVLPGKGAETREHKPETFGLEYGSGMAEVE